MRFLFLLFIIMPIVEIAVLIQIGQVIGALWTIALVVLTAVIGINMLRAQGLATLTRAHWRMQSGTIPAQEMAEAIFLAIGGALLLTPGVITDAIGFLCLMPFTRLWMVKTIQVKFMSAVAANFSQTNGQHFSQTFGNANATQNQYRNEDDDSIIEGEFKSEIDAKIASDTQHKTNNKDSDKS